MSEGYATVVVDKERNPMFTLMEYTLNGSKVVSAIHALDLRKFLDEFPDAKPFKR